MFHTGEYLILSITLHENRSTHYLSEQSFQILIIEIFQLLMEYAQTLLFEAASIHTDFDRDFCVTEFS